MFCFSDRFFCIMSNGRIYFNADIPIFAFRSDIDIGKNICGKADVVASELLINLMRRFSGIDQRSDILVIFLTFGNGFFKY